MLPSFAVVGEQTPPNFIIFGRQNVHSPENYVDSRRTLKGREFADIVLFQEKLPRETRDHSFPKMMALGFFIIVELALVVLHSQTENVHSHSNKSRKS